MNKLLVFACILVAVVIIAVVSTVLLDFTPTFHGGAMR